MPKFEELENVFYVLSESIEQSDQLGVLTSRIRMLSLFKSDPIKKLESKHLKMLEESRHIQRSGDLKKYAFHMEAISKLETEIEALRSKKH